MKTLLATAAVVGLLASAPANAGVNHENACEVFSGYSYVYTIGVNDGVERIFASNQAKFDTWQKVRTYLNNNAIDTSEDVHLFQYFPGKGYLEVIGGIRREAFSFIGDFDCQTQTPVE